MKKIFSILLAQVIFIISSAQQGKVDSLLEELKITKADTDKVKDLYILSDALKDKEPTKSIEYANQGLTLSKSIGYRKGIAMCLSAIGNANSSLGENRVALKFYKEHLKIDTELSDSIGIARAYDNMSIVYIHLGNIDSALLLRYKAFEIYTALKMDGRIALGHIWIGNIFMEQGENAKAMENFLKALDIYESIHDSTNLAYALVNITSIYRLNKQYDKAKKSAFDAMALFLKSGDNYGVGASLYRLSLIYLDLNNIDSATFYLLQSRKTFEKIKNKYFLALVNNELGESARKAGNEIEALQFFNESLTNSYEMDDKRLIALALGNIGIVYKEQGIYQRALDSINKSVRILNDINDKNSLKDLTEHLLEIYSRINKPDSVLKYFSLFKSLSDTIYFDQTAKVNTVIDRYKEEKRENENATLKLENLQKESEMRIQKIVRIGLLCVVVILLTFIYFIVRTNKQKTLAEKILQIQKLEKQRSEIRENISQDIHDDVSSGLTKITMLCDQGKIIPENQTHNTTSFFDQISIQSQELGESLNDVIWATNPKNDNLLSLTSRMRTYTYGFLENSNINIIMNLPDDQGSLSTNPRTNRNLYLILKEALHNIQKYSSASEVQIDLFVDGESIFKFVIKDNGKGFDTSSHSNGNGRKNMAIRTNQIKEGKFHLQSEAGRGTTISVEGILV